MTALLPYNASALERALEGATARIGDIPVPLRDLWSPQRCPLELLPWLAWALSVEEWDPQWPERVKRSIVADAIAVHREKGTVAALRRILEAVGAGYDYTERPAGVAMTATVTIFNGASIELDGLAGIKSAIDRVKRASLHVTVVLLSGLAGEVPVASGIGALHIVGFEVRGL